MGLIHWKYVELLISYGLSNLQQINALNCLFYGTISLLQHPTELVENKWPHYSIAMYGWDLNNYFRWGKRSLLLSECHLEFLSDYIKTWCPISSVCLPACSAQEKGSRLWALFYAHNSTLFLLPEAINVERRFYKEDKEK